MQVMKWCLSKENGYVIVKRDGESIFAATDRPSKMIIGGDFLDIKFRKCNVTRIKAMDVLKENGYK